ncbi:uncharacterized protein EV422DRAFT_510845 [Fimicolochytrium jonesii]|uniref:uncharacterized protein n=1 Tax=Fimicolochytrium jonesii TaxID=1396493 RepID=UPI0022FEE760|nr:uncharacterized protein EV422DRAFT_510845 [Fimicolochytrium jonesii]KAI8826609.1 hypothetical protein EV422DRAFT_510845 [Fimicolochytrium jonesii]
MSVIISTLRHPASLALTAVFLSWWLYTTVNSNRTTPRAPSETPKEVGEDIVEKEKVVVSSAKLAAQDARKRRKQRRDEKKAAAKGCCQTGEEESNGTGCCSTGGEKADAGCCKTAPASVTETPAVTLAELGEDTDVKKTTLKIIYGTQTRTSRALSYRLKELVEASIPLIKDVQVINIADYENEDLLTEKSPVVFFLSTYTEGTPTEDCSWFYQWLEDVRYDHRVNKQCMKGLKFAVFGLGDSVYTDHYCTVAKVVDKYIGELGGRRMAPLAFGDKSDDTEAQFLKWTTLYLSRLLGVANHLSVADEMEFADADVSGDEEDEEESADEEDGDAAAGGSGDELMDLEDMGAMASKIKDAKTRKADEESAFKASKGFKGSKGTETEEVRPERVAKEMVTPMLRKSLEKQGYKIVGTHSGVKICRWTKAMLRGRGGCYKHTFYGIESHRCMETTPSLACANKCVFCWRQHTNPVGTEWRWKQDDALEVVDGAMEGHYKMIKQLKGVPGVKADRFEEAFTIKHCALSLVGEPIMYPQINEFVQILHSRNISSFLVTNAQFPDAIDALVPVTQLYVSIDAGTKEDLKKIDRPLFKDYWERFLACLDALGKKGQRTVYRLTLVKDKNDTTMDDYATLIARGNPDFIEVKGVTYCGFSGASHLTMKNVPYHHEVLQFCKNLCDKLGDDKYAVACVHEHSCSVLIADKTRYYKEGGWWTWIDYDRFFELVRDGKEFTSLDYMQRTPDWGVVGNEAAGFDPAETRFHRKSKKTAIVEVAHEETAGR